MVADATALVLGATGMLGQALMAYARSHGMRALGAARQGTDLSFDLLDGASVAAVVKTVRPALVINAAAMTDLAACEADPKRAFAVNAGAVGVLAEVCGEVTARLIHISTDHFFVGDGDKLHVETAPVHIVNEYARSKLAGETLALASPAALVVRTNVTGFRGWTGRPTFAEWMFESIMSNAETVLFDDFICSTIDARALAKAIFRLDEANATGLLNVAARQPASKKKFVEEVAKILGRPLTRCKTGSVASLVPRRAESLALDVGAAECKLGYRLPSVTDVACSLVEEYRNRCDTVTPFR
ncbi:MAG: NAD(P)-dependent oxidoreductase [Sphingomonadales bacterium]